MSNQIPVTCPSCRSALKIRLEYFGAAVECKQCRHRFTPAPADVMDLTGFSASSSNPVADEKVRATCPGCRRNLRVRANAVGQLIRCKGCDCQFIASTASDEASPRWISQPIPTSREKTDRLKRELLDFRSEVARLAGRLGEAEAAVEKLLVKEPDGDGGLEQADIDRETLRQDLATLRESFSSVRSDFQDFREVIRSGREVERQAIEQLVEARIESEREIARFQLDPLRTEVEELRQQNAELSCRVLEFERFRDECQAIDPAADASSEAIASEAEVAALPRELESLRLELDAMKRDAQARAERFRSDLAELRAGLESRTSPSSLAGPASSDLPAYRIEAPVGLANDLRGPAIEASRLDLEMLAEDLVFDHLARTDQRLDAEHSEARVSSSPKVASISPVIVAEYEQLGQRFLKWMDHGDITRAIAAARSLVTLTREHFGEQKTLEHAVWLRNLGSSLTRGGELTEAWTVLHHAMDLFQELSISDPMPRAIGLLDLADLYLEQGDALQATVVCQEALASSKAYVGPDHPFVKRAQMCLARIGAASFVPAKVQTVSISS